MFVATVHRKGWPLILGLVAAILLGATVITEASSNNLSRTGFPLVVTQTLTPEEVFLLESDLHPQTATVEITLSNPQRLLRPLDILLILDTSHSAQLRDVQALGKEIVANLSTPDRVGVVTTAGYPHLALGLTNDFAAVDELITDLLPGGAAHLAASLRLAIEELRFHGRPDVEQVIILTGSGLDASASTYALLAQAEEARQAGIRIFPIGTASLLDAKTLSRIALITKGRFYTRFGPQTITSLFRRLQREIVSPRDIVIRQVLPPYIEYLGAEVNPPSLIERRGPGRSTLLQWRISTLAAGSSWKARFTIGSTKAGRVPIFSHQWRPRIALISEDSLFGPTRRELILPMLRLNVRAVPVAKFSFIPHNPLTGEDIRFRNLSIKLDGRIVAWEWYFGDGEMSREQNPIHRYESPGKYAVLLVVTDEDGATAIAFQKVTVREMPPPPPVEKICADAILAVVSRVIKDPETIEAIKAALARHEPLREELNRIMDLLASVTLWDSETIRRANQRVIEFLKAVLEVVPAPSVQVESHALAILFEFIDNWPEVRASCQAE
jgi:hypothetical protein